MGHGLRPAVEEIALFVPFVVRVAGLQHLTEESRILGGDDAQSFKIAGARRLDVHLLARVTRDDGVDGEFVRACMNAQLVPVEMAHDRNVARQFSLEEIQIAHVIDALLELAHKAGRQAHHGRAAPEQFVGDEVMLMHRSWRVRLVDRHLQIKGLRAPGCAQGIGNRKGMDQGAPILGQTAQQRLFVKGQRKPIHDHGRITVGRAQRRIICFQQGPGQTIALGAQDVRGIDLRVVIDVIAGIDGIEGITGGHVRREMYDLLDVIGICAPGRTPVTRKKSPDCGGHHRFRRAVQPLVFPYRLLGEDGCKGAGWIGRAQGRNVAGCGAAQAIAEAERERLA